MKYSIHGLLAVFFCFGTLNPLQDWNETRIINSSFKMIPYFSLSFPWDFFPKILSFNCSLCELEYLNIHFLIYYEAHDVVPKV